ncbi:unnamed protein product, partial [Closterium sp. NIES-54]
YDKAGHPFDSGCMQRAFFVALLRLESNSSSNASSSNNSSSSRRQGEGGEQQDRTMRSARLTEVPARADSLKGWSDLRLAAQVNYRHDSSSHQVCFTAPVPGPYLLSLHLLFTNAFQLRSNRSPAFNHGYAGYEQVFARVIRVVAPPTYYPLALRALLPWCTAALLRTHGNEGYWLQHKWMPHACRLRTVTPVDALSCFHRHRNVLIMGDSEMRFFFGFLTHFLVNRTRGTYLRSMGGDLQAFHGLQSLPKTTNYTDGSGELLRTPVPFPPPLFTFYGGLHNGFTRQQFNVSMRGRTYLFNLTYASHMGAEHEVLPAWMYNTSLTGGEVVSRPDTPFRLAAYGSSLHDLITLDTAQDYARVARSHLLPSLQRLLQDPRRVTVFGPWAAREDSKPPGLLFKSDNVRGLAFEQEAARVLPSEGFGNFIPLTMLTLPRPDLTMDSTHYSWVVTLAMLDLWLTTGRIVSMYLPNARLLGPIPPAIGRLTSLTMLDLSSNSLGGSLPSSLGLLYRLAHLDVSDNNLNGSLPASLSALSDLSHLNMSCNLHYLGDSNGISESDLSPLLRLSSLSVLDLSYNQMAGPFLSSLHLLPNLHHLNLRWNQFLGPLPSNLTALVNLTSLDISLNMLSGSIPASIAQLSLLNTLSVQAPPYPHPPTHPPTSLHCCILHCSMHRCMINALATWTHRHTSPHTHVRLRPSLRPLLVHALYLASPACVSARASAVQEAAGHECVRVCSGGLHPCFPLLPHTPHCAHHGISIHDCMACHDDAMGITIHDCMAHDCMAHDCMAHGAWHMAHGRDLSAAPRVNQSASQDRFTGPIPPSLAFLSRLTSLEMASNDLQGSIPESLGNLKALVKLDLSSNRLSGSLSPMLGTLPFLHTLLLNNNSLQGVLPASLGGLWQIEMLDVAYNALSGVIPPALGTLPNLLTLSIWPSSETPGPVCPSPASCPISPLPLSAFCLLCPRYCTACAPAAGALERNSWGLVGRGGGGRYGSRGAEADGGGCHERHMCGL